MKMMGDEGEGNLTFAGRYQAVGILGEGNGSRTKVFRVHDIITGDVGVLKWEDPKDVPISQLTREKEVLESVEHLEGFPKLLWYSTDNQNFRMLVMNPLGLSLDDLFLEHCSKQFSMKTMLMLADQMITRLEQLHSQGYIHRDISAKSFHMGINEGVATVHLLCFGEAKKFLIDGENGPVHIPFLENRKAIKGTVRYASLNAHDGYELSRRDDLESLGYVFFYFLSGGKLPWQGLSHASVTELHDLIGNTKIKAIYSKNLGKGYPLEFQTFFDYSSSLGFDEQPDYNYLRGLFRDLMKKLAYKNDLDFDWHIFFDWDPVNVNPDGEDVNAKAGDWEPKEAQLNSKENDAEEGDLGGSVPEMEEVSALIVVKEEPQEDEQPTEEEASEAVEGDQSEAAAEERELGGIVPEMEEASAPVVVKEEPQEDKQPTEEEASKAVEGDQSESEAGAEKTAEELEAAYNAALKVIEEFPARIMEVCLEAIEHAIKM